MLDPNFEDEFKRLTKLNKEIDEILKTIDDYPELWCAAYEALKPIRSGKPVVLWQGTYEAYTGASQQVFLYMSTGFLCKWEYWERGKDLFIEEGYSTSYYRNRIEELLKIPIFDFLRQNLDIILEKCRASIREDLEFLLKHPPLPIKSELKTVSVEAEDIAIIRGWQILKYPQAKLEVTSSFSGLKLVLKAPGIEGMEGIDGFWVLGPTDFWNSNLRIALIQLLEKTLETWSSQLPIDFYDNIKRLKEIVELRKLARLLRNSDLEVYMSITVEITGFEYNGFNGQIKVGDKRRRISLRFYPQAWVYCFGLWLEDGLLFLTSESTLEKLLEDISTANWKFDFLRHFGYIVTTRTSSYHLKTIYCDYGRLTKEWALNLLETMYRSLAHQRGEYHKLMRFKAAIQLLEQAFGLKMEKWCRKAENLKFRWLAHQLQTSLEVSHRSWWK